MNLATLLYDCVRDVRYALRSFSRAPLAAFTIVTTVALGLGLVAVVFTYLNIFFFRVDQVPRPHELYGVERPRLANGDSSRFTRPEYEALRRETRVFADPFAMLPDIDMRIDGRMMAGTLVTGNFFRAVGVGAALGRTLMPADEDPGAQPVMVLTHRGWTELYDGARDILGRRVPVNGMPFEIVGVMPDGFRGLDVGTPDYFAPLAQLGQFRRFLAGRENVVQIDVVGRLNPGSSRESALAALEAWNAARTGGSSGDRSAARLVLSPHQGTLPQPLEGVILFTPIFFAFGLILMIGCSNVANLLLARAVSRQREIGIRLSIGASRGRIVRQLLTESLLLAIVAAGLGYVISRLILVAGIRAAMSTMAPEIAEIVQLTTPAADWRVAVFLLGGAVVSTAFFGLAPALQATRLELVRTMRGEMTRDGRPRRSRNVLIGLQVTASALLLICSAVFLRSALAATTVDPGIRTADTMLVDGINDEMRGALIAAVRSEPSIAAMAAGWPDVISRPRVAFADALDRGGVKSTIAYRFVSPEYFNVLGVDILRGRGFSESERSAETGVVVISESVARQLWPDGSALGRSVSIEPDPDSETRRSDEPELTARTLTVVGISRDVPGFRFAGFKEAGVYIPIDASVARTSLTLRVHGDPEQARQALLQRLTAIDPSMGGVMTLRTVARIETYVLQIAFWVTLGLGGLALLLTLSGLFSVLSYLVEQRSKEIGVRMALGATARHIGRLVVSDVARPVSIGLAAGVTLAASLATLLMASPMAAQIGAIVRVFDPVAYAASLAVIIAACAAAALIPSLRAARIDPIATLRQD